MQNNKVNQKKILVIHNRGYFISGPERFIYNFSSVFQDAKVDIFCMDYKKNNMPGLLSNLPQPLTSGDEYSLSNQQIGLFKKIHLFTKTLFNVEAYKALKMHLRASHYDVILICQFQFKLSPSIFLAINRFAKHSKVIIRSSDYYLSCIRNTFTDTQGKVCTKCNSNRFSAIKKRCGGPLLYSTHRVVGNFILHKMMGLVRPRLIWTNSFAHKIAEENVYLSRFKKDTITTFDLSDSDFFDSQVFKQSRKQYDFVFFGRISYDKGFAEIIKLFNNSRFTIAIVGTVDNSCKDEFSKFIQLDNIKHFDFLEKTELMEVINASKFSLIFSNWFDNLPNSLIESYALGVPVICYDFGSFTEFIPKEYHSLFKNKYSPKDLELFMSADYESLSQAVKDIHSQQFSPELFRKRFDAL